MECIKIKDIILCGDKEISLYEAIYLLEKGKIIIKDEYGKTLKLEDLLKINDQIKINYVVYKFLKDKKYRFGTAMKFGSPFRIYENPDDEHSRWICFPVSIDDNFVVYDFLAKNRVAHSTRKSLLIALVDNNNKIKFIESKWKRL